MCHLDRNVATFVLNAPEEADDGFRRIRLWKMLTEHPTGPRAVHHSGLSGTSLCIQLLMMMKVELMCASGRNVQVEGANTPSQGGSRERLPK